MEAHRIAAACVTRWLGSFLLLSHNQHRLKESRVVDVPHAEEAAELNAQAGRVAWALRAR